MLEEGGPYSYYGYYDSWKGQQVKEHLKTCGLNWSKMSTPTMSREEEFNGTFAESHAYVDVVKGFIVCNCDEYEYDKYEWSMQDWCVRDKTLGQLIWHVVKAGEVKNV